MEFVASKRFKAIIAVCWLLLIVFANVGLALGREFALFVVIVAALTWTQYRIVIEGYRAWMYLMTSKGHDDNDDDWKGPFASV